MSEIKQYITKGTKLDNKYRYSKKHITQTKEETDYEYKKRIEHETYHFRLVNNKEDYTFIKDYDKDGNKRVLIYIQVL